MVRWPLEKHTVEDTTLSKYFSLESPEVFRFCNIQRLRIGLYHRKMGLQNKKKEATINLLTSLSGLAWRQIEHDADKLADEEEGFTRALKMLDACFK